MNTFDDDTLLSDRLHRIGAAAPVPHPDLPGDVRRGRRRVLRARLVATAGTALAVGIIGIAGVALRPILADRAVDPAGSPTTTSTSSVRTAESVVQALPSTFDLAINLIFERDAALAGVPAGVMKPMEKTTDEAITTWTAKAEQIDTGRDPELADAVAEIQQSLDGLTQMRSDMGDTAKTQAAAEAAYTELSNDLFGLSAAVPSVGDAEIDTQIEALGHVRPIFESLGTERIIMTKALTMRQVAQAGGATGEASLSKEELGELAAAEATFRRSLADLYAATSESQRKTLDQFTLDSAADGAVGVPAQRAVNQVVSTGSLDRVTMTPDQYVASCTELIRGLQKVSVAVANEVLDDL